MVQNVEKLRPKSQNSGLAQEPEFGILADREIPAGKTGTAQHAARLQWPAVTCMFSILSGAEAQIVNLLATGQTYLTRRKMDRSPGALVLECTAAFLLSLGLMLCIQFASPAIVGNDAYYHIRWSRILLSSAPHLPAFTSLPLTVLRPSAFVDQHFLFHVLLMPFTLGDLRVGAKLAAPLFSALALASIFWLLVTYRVRYRWLWLLPLAAGSEPFLYRMSMTRAPSLSLALLGLGVYVILERRFVYLVFLTFIFVWLYNLFPLILVFAFAHAVTVWLSERRLDFAALYATSLGAALGLVINPYFPKDFVLIFHHAHMLLAETTAIDVGSEWYPYDTSEVLTKSAAVFALYFAALLAFNFRKRSSDNPPLFFLLLAAVFLLMSLRWRRFFEYWPPFAVLFAAFTFDAELPEFTRRLRLRLSMVALLTVLGAITILNVRAARAEIRDIRDPFAMRGASAWLATHTPAGSLVFNADWVEFPELFYYNQRNVYVTGLDPRYLFDSQPELWKVYDRITQGQEKHPGPIIREHFGTQYVVARNDSTEFLDAAKASGDFETVYSDAYASVLRISQ